MVLICGLVTRLVSELSAQRRLSKLFDSYTATAMNDAAKAKSPRQGTMLTNQLALVAASRVCQLV